MNKYSEAGLNGMQLYMGSRFRPSTVELAEIWIDKPAQGSGVGTAIMNELVQWADSNGLAIHLSLGDKSQGRGTTSSNRLRKFYKSFGFVDNKGRNADYSISSQMYRRPTTTENNGELKN